MTREEAIKIIQNEYKCVDRECDIEKSCGKCPYMIPSKEPILKAYEMAIQVLSQEPTVTTNNNEPITIIYPTIVCDDAISREEVLKLVANYDLSMGQVVKGIHALPPVTTMCDATPTEVKFDVVSRDAVIKAVDAHTNEDGTLDDDITCILEELPPVTQKPKYRIDKNNKIYKMPDDIPIMTIQYPTIIHGDTISRTEVMKVISDFVTFEKYIDKHNHITFEPLEKMINALPSVTQKSGHWIYTGDYLTEGMLKCSECGEEIDVSESYYDFCPVCGARMAESEDKTE